MGIFSSPADDIEKGISQAESSINKQVEQNKAQIEQQRQELYQTRLDIIKGQGAQSWTPNMNQKAPINSSTPGK